ncbi:zinc finger protein ZIC 3-like [Sitodiplosis mosellana]|uniref:zinc finger protein ZIC 3-like n=1 Tax=Sitodiplosis mosellana TaxID=263140 RepID=UPI0024447D44|nr:zinc finger protein ZIC 3-like [Sitodiplosis mosellana]
MEELNVFGDDFLSNGEFHHLYTTFDSQGDICLWDNRIDFDFQSKWNSASDFSSEPSSYSNYSPCQVTGYINFVDNNSFGEFASHNQHSTSGERDQNYAAVSTDSFLGDICDMDEWKQNHMDDLLYHSNNNDWELNLDNLIMENPYEDSVFNVCDLPARTLYCNDSCTNFLKETSEHLDTSLRTFQPNSTYEATTSNATHSNYNTNDRKKCPTNGTEEKEFICNYGECRKVYAKAGHLKAHIRRHVGDKPYVCHWPNCTWKFSRSDELSRHRRSHSGIKPYQCDLCPKCFSRSDHLTKHRKVHERKMAAMKIKAVWTKLPPRKPGRKPKSQTMQQ